MKQLQMLLTTLQRKLLPGLLLEAITMKSSDILHQLLRVAVEVVAIAVAAVAQRQLGEEQATVVVEAAIATVMEAVEAQFHQMVDVAVESHQETVVEAVAVDIQAEVVNLRFFYL